MTDLTYVSTETENALSGGAFWEEFVSDVRVMQERLFSDTVTQLWYSTVLYACLRSGVLRLSTELVSTLMQVLKAPATLMEDIIVQVSTIGC